MYYAQKCQNNVTVTQKKNVWCLYPVHSNRRWQDVGELTICLKTRKRKGERRIIYVVPYTTIIEQNAQEVREKLGAADDLLEHHSNIIDDDVWDKKDVGDEFEEGSHTKQQKLKLTKDDFSAPIIFTTMVQFLNIFFMRKAIEIHVAFIILAMLSLSLTKCRKYH